MCPAGASSWGQDSPFTSAEIVGTLCQEISWQAGNVHSVKNSSSHVHRLSIKKSAHRRNASANASCAGTKPNVKLIQPTMPTRESTPKSGPICTPIISVNTELKIPTLPNGIEPNKKIATKNVELLLLQRWTRQSRKAPCRLAFTG